MSFKAHSEKQQQALFSDKKIVLCATGVQWGKTRVGAHRMKIAMHRFTDKEDAFLITAPTYKIMQQSTLPAFLAIMEGCGTYHKQSAEFHMNGGGVAYFRTATDPDSIVGVTNIRHIWGDEAGKYSLYFWENLQARAAFKEAPIDLTTSPYTLNWVYKEIIKPRMKNTAARSDCEIVQASSWENPYFPSESIKRARDTMDARRFNMMFGGEWHKVEGLVYDCFDESENICEASALPTGTKFFAGIDWGSTHPFALVVRAITPYGKHYQVSEVYKSGLTLSQIVEICRQKKSVFNIEKFYCDPSRPENIEELCRHGCPATAANNSVQLGIDKHYELIKTRTYKVFAGTSPFTLDEYETYHYAEPDDIEPDKDRKERGPVKQSDDAMDANRYVTVMTSLGIDKKTPKTPDEKHEYKPGQQHFLKRSRFRDQTEKWN